MSVSDFLKDEQLNDPKVVRDILMLTIAQNNWEAFEITCKEQAGTIYNNFISWTSFPEEVLKDKQQLQLYGTMLISVAKVFEKMGRPDLLEFLDKGPEDNPLIHWESALGKAQELLSQSKFDEAEKLLRQTLVEADMLVGTGLDVYTPMTLGLLGQSLFHRGEVEAAAEQLLKAFEMCKKNDDKEGVTAYANSMYELRRYQGNIEEAAMYGTLTADMLAIQGQNKEAERWRKQVELLKSGEPLNRVILLVDDLKYELSELDEIDFSSRSVKFTFERNRLTIDISAHYCDLASDLALKGSFKEALELYAKAASADKYNPHPKYLEGLTHLHLKQYNEAAKAYSAAEKLAPGWFTVRSELWMAQQLGKGRFTHELFLALFQIEEENLSAAEKVEQCKLWIEKVPDLATIHLYLGKNLQALDKNDEAAESFRNGLKLAEEDDVKTRLLTALGAITQDDEERSKLLDEAIKLNGNLVSAAMAAVMKHSRL
jgi:tetratricopeptide (TPR) repeat protein